jgi:hypothetical protein
MVDQTRVRRIVLEGFVVVASILLAFAIDAWWEEAREASQERALLVALSEELDNTRGLLEDNVRFHEDQLRRTGALLEIAAGQPSRVSTDSLDHLFAGLSSWAMASYERGTLDAILIGGAFNLIEDQSLRRVIVEWQRSLNELAEVEADEERVIRDLWFPLLQEATYMPQIFNTGLERIPGWWAAEIPVRGEVDHTSLAGDRAFVNAVLIRQMTHEDILVFQRRVLSKLDSLASMLPGEAPASSGPS